MASSVPGAYATRQDSMPRIASESFLVPSVCPFSERLTSGQLAKHRTFTVELDGQFQFSEPPKPRRPPGALPGEAQI